MKNTKSAFTLVELIVVITILAILGTIAFISLQGYSADARNSKRTSDLGNIQSAISLKQVEGVPLMSFVSSVGDSEVANIDLAGLNGTVAAGDYSAGTPVYTVLNVAQKDFLDPSADKEYRIGATTLKGGVFQLAATMEIDSTPTALVNGTYVQRTAVQKTGVVTDGDTMTVDDADANFFKVGDTVTNGAGNVVIKKVSRDGVTITFNTGEASGSTLQLATAEENGLIDAKGTATGAVVDGLTTNLPY